MDKFMQTENVLLAVSASSSRGPSSEDMDFKDVFGGPPRRFSMQEVRVRYSFGETVEPQREEEASLTEKPVFGEESGPRRRHQGDDFFDDIFRGSSESYSSPRRSDRDRDNVLGSSPGSRIMSPAKTLSPRVEPFGTSLPTQFSLPAKMSQAIELPTFGSNNHGSANALNSPHASSPLSRSSNQPFKGHEKIRSEVNPFHRQSPLSRQSSFNATSDQKDALDIFDKDTRNVDSFGNKFHFSIYKWAGKGVPMLFPIVNGNNLKSKGTNNYDRSESLKIERENKDFLRGKETSKEHQSSNQEPIYDIPESISRRILNDDVVNDGGRQNVKDEEVKSLDDGDDVGEKIKTEVPLKKEESFKNEAKPLRAFISEDIDQPGIIPETKESKTRTSKGVHANARDRKNVKKHGTKTEPNSATVDKSESSLNRGKVREFVQIFNQDTDSRRKTDFQRSQSSRCNNLGLDQNENVVISNVAKAEDKVNLHNKDNKSDVSLKVDENINKDEARVHATNHVSTNLRETFFSETIHRDSKISVDAFDDPLEDNFLVQELSDFHEKATLDESSEDTKAIDGKIQQWSVGKKGNIRSLLSTLQYVLWAESGWKPVPLVDLIEANAVKRAYQKALLRLHPDKLQQKGAPFHHKYIAEKVFDILQEAWDHYNTCSSLNL